MEVLFRFFIYLFLTGTNFSCDMPINHWKTHLTAESSHFNLSDKKISLFFSVSNQSEQTEKFCVYATPFEGLTGNVLEVKNESGKDVEFTGIMVKRGEPTDSDFISVPEETILTTQFNLFEDFNLKEKGKYYIKFIGNEYLNQLPNSNILEITLK